MTGSARQQTTRPAAAAGGSRGGEVSDRECEAADHKTCSGSRGQQAPVETAGHCSATRDGGTTAVLTRDGRTTAVPLGMVGPLQCY